MAGIEDILNRQNIDADQWMFGLKERSFFGIRIKNRMFKERSNDLNADVILNFGHVIKKKAWIREKYNSL